MLKFLHSIETSQFPLKVVDMRIRVVRQKDARLIDLSLGLQSHSKQEEG